MDTSVAASTYETSQIQPRPKTFGVRLTLASRKRISDLWLPLLIKPSQELSIDLSSVRSLDPAVELTNPCSSATIVVGSKLRLDTAHRALSEISPQCSRAGKNATGHQFGSLRPVSELVEVAVKFLNRTAHVYDWELARRVGSTPEVAELTMPNVVGHRRTKSQGIVPYTVELLREWTTAASSVSKDGHQYRALFGILLVRRSMMAATCQQMSKMKVTFGS